MSRSMSPLLFSVPIYSLATQVFSIFLSCLTHRSIPAPSSTRSILPNFRHSFYLSRPSQCLGYHGPLPARIAPIKAPVGPLLLAMRLFKKCTLSSSSPSFPHRSTDCAAPPRHATRILPRWSSANPAQYSYATWPACPLWRAHSSLLLC